MILLDKKDNNLLGHCLLATIDIPIKLEYINNINIADNYVVTLTLWYTGSEICIKYCKELEKSHNFIKKEGNVLFFNCNHVFKEDYTNIVNGQYSKISEEYREKFKKIYDSLPTNQILMLYLPSIIVANDEKSLLLYWNRKLGQFTDDIKKWIISLMTKSGNYYSKNNKWNNESQQQ